MQIMERNIHLPFLVPLPFVEVFPSCDRTEQFLGWDFANSHRQPWCGRLKNAAYLNWSGTSVSFQNVCVFNLFRKKS